MKKMIQVVIFLIFSVTIFGQSYSGGSGTSADPYQIATKADLKYLSENSGEWTKYFIQTADITFAPADFQSGGDFYNSGSGFIPIGTSSIEFTGVYDGNVKTIYNLTITRYLQNFIGFIGFLGETGTVKNLTIQNASVSGYNATGIIVGKNTGGTVSFCRSTGSVSGNLWTGGLVGFNDGGASNMGEILRSVSEANVSSSNNTVGGLVGQNYNTGTQAAIIQDSYATGSVSTSADYAGGLVGYQSSPGQILRCYSVGSVSAVGANLGGLAGFNGGTVSASFYNTDSTSAGGDGTGETSANLKTSSTFTNAGWSYRVWYMDSGINNGYPYLAWQNAGGTPLPVELSGFSAKSVNDKVELSWLTASEVNNYGFEVQRLPAGRQGETVISSSPSGEARNLTWEKIGFVAGAGNSNSPKSYTFTDQPTGGTSFSYRLKQIDNDGKYKYYDAITVSLTTSAKPELMQNSPNPFNPSTTIKYYIPNNSDVSIKIYDMLGREVTTLINKQTEAGYHIVYWNGMDRYGDQAASGIYLYRLTAGNYSETKKMLLMK